MSGPRNNYSRLPWAIRYRILGMLHDGAEQSEILADSAIKAALAERKLSLHGTTFLAIRRSSEYRDYIKSATDDIAARKAEKITAAVLENTEALSDITDVARYELAKLVRDEIQTTAGDEDSLKRVRSLSQSIAALSKGAIDRKFAKKDEEIAALKNEIARINLEHAVEIRKLQDLITGLKGSGNNKGVTEETMRAVEEKIGLL